VELWQAQLGEEQRVKAAEQLFDDPADLDATGRFLADEANHLLIAYVDGEPAGFVTGTELTHPDKPAPELFLNELGVAEEHRGRGIGRALVTRLWEIAQSRGCRAMWVLTDDGNPAALRTYAAAGATRSAEPQVILEWGES
jgi:[ribosomal protein S18]-alanine N-acetyltransferase